MAYPNDYRVEVDWHWRTWVPGQTIGLMARASGTGSPTGYYGLYVGSVSGKNSGYWSIIRYVSWDDTELARTPTFAYAYPTNTVSHVALDVHGTTITLIVDGRPVLTVEDSSLTSGKAGIRATGTDASSVSTATQGIALDNLRITTAAPTGPVEQVGAVGMDGRSSMSASGVVTAGFTPVSGAAVIDMASALSADAVKQVYGGGSCASTSDVTAAPVTVRSTQADLGAVSTASSSGVSERRASSTLEASSAVQADAVVTVGGASVEMASSSSASGQAQATRQGTATTGSVSDLVASGVQVQRSGATVVATSSAVGAGLRVVPAASTMGTTSAMAADSNVSQGAGITLSAQSSVQVTARREQQGSVSMAVEATLASSSVATRRADISMEAHGSVEVSAIRTFNGSTSINAQGGISADARRILQGVSTILTTSSIAAGFDPLVEGRADLFAHSSVRAALYVFLKDVPARNQAIAGAEESHVVSVRRNETVAVLPPRKTSARIGDR